MRGPMACALCAAMFGCVGMLGIFGSPALGGTLDLSPQNPDLYAGFLTAQYTPPTGGSTGTFSATGFPITFTITGTNTQYTMSTSGPYDLTAQIDPATGDATSGTLTIGGTIQPFATSGTLLTGDLSQFSYLSSGGDVFQFLFNVTGGDLKSYYPGQIGVILTAYGSGFTGSFSTPFTTGVSQAYSDNFNYTVVPEPTSFVLLLGALAGALFRFRRKQCGGSSN
jgi:hypothetical protein